MLSIIAAIDEKRGLGKKNELLFKIPEDLQRFRALTLNHPIIMGRKTYESIGRPLPKRTNIVVTRDKNYHAEGILVCGSLEEAIEKAKRQHVILVSETHPESLRRRSWTSQDDDSLSSEVFIIGGGQIFSQALPFADRLYLTLVKGDYGADTFFPEYKHLFKKVVHKESGKSGKYEYTFLDLEH